VRYALLIRGDNVKVRKYEGERDYSLDVAMTFAKFQQGQVKQHSRKFSDVIAMNHVEAGILDRVAKLFPEEFAALERFWHDWTEFRDPVITRFEREIQFYLAYLDHIAPLRQAGLSFCYPLLSGSDKAISVSDCFDLALAGKLAESKRPVIPNEVRLQGPERILVVSGPNQGGKTTFARMFGQIHYLAALGCPVPGRDARLFLFDEIFTHFEREETIASERSKLEDDLCRIHEILAQATSRSIIIVNEIFTSTTLDDAIELGQKVMAQIIARDALCVCVTFIDELFRQGPKVVSMVSTIVPEDPARRTFKVVRRRADGQAFAIILAEHHGLTSRQIMRRIEA